jgi:hypothetical protein
MANLPNQLGDATLCYDGRVKIDGEVVGKWWRDENDMYCFSPKDAEVMVAVLMRHMLKSHIPILLKQLQE